MLLSKQFRFSSAFGLLLVCSFCLPVSADTVDVYFITGQSNAGNIGELAQTGSTDVGFNLSFANIEDRDPSGGQSDLSSTDIKFSTQFLADNSSSAAPTTAITQLAKDLYAGNDMGLYAFARNGRPLSLSANTDESWYPGDDPKSGNYNGTQLYDHFRAWGNDRLAEIIAQGDTPVVKGVFWFQGEGDVGLGDQAVADYQANLSNLVYRMREDFGSDIGFVATDIRVVPGASAAVRGRQQGINDAYANLTNLEDKFGVVPTADLTTGRFGPNDVHFIDPDYYTISQRWATEMNRLNAIPEPTSGLVLCFASIGFLLRRTRS